MPIFSENNRVIVTGEFGHDDALRFTAATHNLINSKGYQDIILDFQSCSKAFALPMLMICSQVLLQWKNGLDFKLELPTQDPMKRLFLNTNWAHFLDPNQCEESRFRGYTHAPAIRFRDGSEQFAAINKMMDVLLAAISHFRRDDIRYIEWALNEITDNVINHSSSVVGGLVQVTNFRQRQQIEFVVSDSGFGIPHTLRTGQAQLMSDTEALDAAIREGVTRDKSVGQGNGLYGTWRICQKPEGAFSIYSNHASLNSSRNEGVRVTNNAIPVNGATVSARIGYSEHFNLSEALVFKGKVHVPIDYIEIHFDEDEEGNVKFVLSNESTGFGSRVAGDPVRRKLHNIVSFLSNGRVIVDLNNVPILSSSYADEVFGKLFLELGPITFMQKVQLVNVDPLVQQLIDKAIIQRSRQ